MQAEIVDPRLEIVTVAGRNYDTYFATARVTIDGETRELPARLMASNDAEMTWFVPYGFAIVYRTGRKIHQTAAYVRVYSTKPAELDVICPQHRMLSSRSRCIGFYNDGANSASRSAWR